MRTASAVPRQTLVPVAMQTMLEICLLALSWQLYRWGRFLVRDQQRTAFDNADRLNEVESLLQLDLVGRSQQLVIGSDSLITAINNYYVYTHITFTVACLAWLFFRHRSHYECFRTVLVVATGAGLLVHALFPLAPPRLVNEMGLVDTLMVYGPSVYSHDELASITNQFAAMPSFHVGWSVLVAIAVIAASGRPWRWLALAHPAIMTFAVMATANHYFTDALVGGALVVVTLHGRRLWHHRKQPVGARQLRPVSEARGPVQTV